MDINLPGMNAIDALHTLRNCEDTETFSVVSVSANAAERDMEKGRAAGFDEYLTKPIDIAQFEQIVDSFLPPASTV